MQRAEMEELRQRDANLTALQAIGPRKKPRLDGEAATASAVSTPYLTYVFINSNQVLSILNFHTTLPLSKHPQSDKHT